MSFAIDVGGSETRIIMDGGAAQTWPSDYVLISQDAYVHPDLNDKESACEITYNNVTHRVLKGEAMAYSKQAICTCDNNVLKTEFEGTYLNILYAIGRVALANGLSSVSGTSLGVCLPPSEALSETRERFRETLCGDSQVYFPLTGKRINIRFDREHIRVFSEGLASIFAIEDKSIVAKLKRSTVLVCDIGYRSTDISILRKGMPFRGAYDSAMIGGINLEASLKGQLEAQSHFYSAEDLRDILITGAAKDGNGELPLGAVVRDIKRAFIPRVHSAILALLNTSGLNLSTIQMFLPIGRPFAQTGEVGTPCDGGCLVDMLAEALHVPAVTIEDMCYSNVRGVSNLVEYNEGRD